ncbi:GPW/gp25 family protein [Streptomyces sp. NPDC047049]|uniref:GPW/gp25 family protein n=1 Tax=Streptomyces sp. NPDC047049 TaxID=3156688 RepID=UPI0033E56D65
MTDPAGLDMAAVIGSGWRFPGALAHTGRVALASGTDEVEQAIRLILGTAPSERPMRPEFGCGIHHLIFDPLDADTVARADSEVRQALERWEPRVEVAELLFSTEAEDQGVLYIDIHYRLRATNEPRNLVFPFYTIPE